MTELGTMRLRAFFLLAAMFVVGALAGAGLVRHLGLPAPQPPRPPPLEALARLGLTPDQEAKARAVIERHRPELDAIVQETMPRVRAVQDAIDRELAALLTPEQARRLEELKRNAPPRPGPGPMGPPPGMGLGPPPGQPGMPPPLPPPPGAPEPPPRE